MSSAVAWKTWEGQSVGGKFPLRQWLGGSDHSAVFVTERAGQPQKAAIKLVPADGCDPEYQLARWNEAAKLSHPHLLRVFESGRCKLENQPFLYVVTEYADEDLSQILPQRPLSPAEVTDLLPPVLDALSYLHERGFVHSRIRPSNVLAVREQLKLSCDQIVLAEDASSVRRRRDVYDAPETAAGIVWPASDIWSVGATLVATLMQTARFSAEGSQADPGLPASMQEPFRGIARECLHFDPKRRCSIADILARLQPAARSVPAEQMIEPVPPPTQSSRGPVVYGLLLVAVLVGLLIFFFRGRTQTAASQPPVSQPAESSEPAVPAAEPTNPAAQPATPPPVTKPAGSANPPARISSEKSAPGKRLAPAAPSASGGVAVHQVLPEVPRSARNTITGKIRVTVQVQVDSSGKVTDAKLTSPGPSKYFARLALNASQQWEFTPPEASGQPVASVWNLRYRFGRSRTEVSPERAAR